MHFLITKKKPATIIYQINNTPSIILTQLKAIITLLINIKLTIQNHLNPKKNFTTKITKKTTINLITIISSPK